MPQLDYSAYALTVKGKAARARARARYVKKRKAGRLPSKSDALQFDAMALVNAIANWRTK